jgi:hypothetical protein
MRWSGRGLCRFAAFFGLVLFRKCAAMPFWGKLGNNVKTFKYKKDIKKDSLRAKYKHDLKQSIRSGTTSIRDAVKLKDGMNENEWIAMNSS